METGGYWGKTKPPRGVQLDVARTTGLVARWAFNEGNGLPVELISGRMVTASSSIVWAGKPEGRAPFWVKATAQHYTSALSQSIAGGPFTVMIDGRCDYRSLSTFITIGVPGVTDKFVHIFVNDTSTIGFNLYGDDLSASAAVANDGDRFFLFCRLDAAKLQTVILNGKLSGSSRTAGGWFTSTTSVTIGGWPDASNPYAGTINDIAVWNRCLSFQECAELYANQYKDFAPPLWRKIWTPAAPVSASAALSASASLSPVFNLIQAVTESATATLVTDGLPVQLALASADISAGAWTNELGSTTNMYASIGETSPIDSTYIQSESRPNDSQYTVQLGPQPTTPPAGTITLHLRHANDVLNGGTINYTYELMQGAAIVQTFGPYAVSTSVPTEVDAVVSATITDWVTPFSVRVHATQVA